MSVAEGCSIRRSATASPLTGEFAMKCRRGGTEAEDTVKTYRGKRGNQLNTGLRALGWRGDYAA